MTKKNYMKNKKRNIIIVIISIIILLLVFYAFALPPQLFKTPVSTVIFDKNNNLLGAHIAADEQWRFPQSDSVPQKFAACLINFEDKRFYRHFGIDLRAFARAVSQNIKSGEIKSGGSTISMQIIRLSRNGKPRNIYQKIVEIILATRMEISYSKNEILSLYASNAPFGGNVVGLEAASWRYFGRSPSNLSWAESAMLAVLPNSPSLIHLGKNRKTLFEKRNRLLKKIFDNEIINEDTYLLAIEELVPENPKPFPQFAPHLLLRIKSEKKSEAKTKTTIDLELQKQVLRIVENNYKHLSANGIENQAVVVLDVETGDVLVYVGNTFHRKRNDNGNFVDIITAERSPGSVFKPYLYAAMLSSGNILPNTLIPDIPMQIGGFSPKNYNRGYDGVVPASRALARSLNIPAVRMLQDYGVPLFHDKLQKIGINTITQHPDYYGLSLIIGGCEAKLWEMTGTYASMARTLNNYFDYSGKYDKNDFHQPNFRFNKSKSLDKADIKISDLENSSYFSASAIYFTFKAMLDVERPDDESQWKMFGSSKKIAWKTGTSFGFRDAWAIGVTPQYVVGVWVGNSDGEGRPDLVGIKSAAPILFEVFDLLPANSDWFSMPYDDMQKAVVCEKSGFLASDICDDTDSIWIPQNGIRSAVCPYHQLVHLDFTGEFQVNSNCESPQNMKHVSWFILPPAMEWYYQRKNAQYKKLPPFRDDCKDAMNISNSSMQVIYPRNNAKIFVPTNLGGNNGKTVFELAHRNTKTKVFWHIDNQYVGETTNFHQIALNPETGKHKLTVIDENGEKITVNFSVISKQ